MKGPARWLALALCAGALACQDSAGVADGEGASQATPALSLPDLDGAQVSLADFRGRPVLIDFWATWCPPCVYQVPELNALWKAHRAREDLAVLGVAVDVEGAEVVGPWAADQGIEYTVLLGDEALAREFGVVGFPTLVLIDPEGRIDSLHVGLIEHDELEEIVSPFLSGS